MTTEEYAQEITYLALELERISGRLARIEAGVAELHDRLTLRAEDHLEFRREVLDRLEALHLSR